MAQKNLGVVSAYGEWLAQGNSGTKADFLESLNGHPVGSIYESVLDTSPAELFGGTWSVLGAGRVLVGFDETDPDFDTVENTGGEKEHELEQKEMPRHRHTQASHTHTTHTGQIGNGYKGIFTSTSSYGVFTVSGTKLKDWGGTGTAADTYADAKFSATHNSQTPVINFTGGSGSTEAASKGDAHNNLQPYVVVYRWKKTA